MDFDLDDPGMSARPPRSAHLHKELLGVLRVSPLLTLVLDALGLDPSLTSLEVDAVGVSAATKSGVDRKLDRRHILSDRERVPKTRQVVTKLGTQEFDVVVSASPNTLRRSGRDLLGLFGPFIPVRRPGWEWVDVQRVMLELVGCEVVQAAVGPYRVVVVAPCRTAIEGNDHRRSRRRESIRRDNHRRWSKTKAQLPNIALDSATHPGMLIAKLANEVFGQSLLKLLAATPFPVQA